MANLDPERADRAILAWVYNILVNLAVDPASPRKACSRSAVGTVTSRLRRGGRLVPVPVRERAHRLPGESAVHVGHRRDRIGSARRERQEEVITGTDQPTRRAD